MLPGFDPEGTEYNQLILLILMQYQSASLWEEKKEKSAWYKHFKNIIAQLYSPFASVSF